MSTFDIVLPEAIREGTATDAYFQRTVETLAADDRNPNVVAEVTADQFPTGTFEVVAGLKDVAHLLEGLPVDVDALREGQLFDGGPILQVEGSYRSFAVYETALLGFLSHASAVATKALEARQAAPDTPIQSFGTRRVHPAIAGMVERSALIGGLDGFSNVAAGMLLDREAGGTMPHALIISYGRDNQTEAWQAFDRALPESVPRIALCDTYSDEVEEVLTAVDALDDRLKAVRLDTTGSRRGDFRHIVREVQWELDARGHEDIDVFVSGGLTPEDIRRLRPYADGFGIGSYVSTATPIDFALDIVEREGAPAAKRGKLSGRKTVYRTPDGGHHVGLADADGPADGEELMEPLLRDGKIVREFDIDAAAERALADATRVGFN
ncbi:MAG: nicotinate phosphoribosyltransferase [Salinarchaeum sp.]